MQEEVRGRWPEVGVLRDATSATRPCPHESRPSTYLVRKVYNLDPWVDNLGSDISTQVFLGGVTQRDIVGLDGRLGASLLRGLRLLLLVETRHRSNGV